MQTIIASVILIVGYLVIRNLNSKQTGLNSDAARRRSVLREAKIYLAPYKDIWRNLKLSNKYCRIKLGYDGHTITAQDSMNPNCSFRIIRSNVHPIQELWNMFCISFSHNTTFDGLVQLCNTFSAEIELKGETVNLGKSGKEQSYDYLKTDLVSTKNEIISEKEKLDINNASEVELTALPGVSIVMAKKLIKKREEIGGFKSVNDVCLFLKLKPHMQTQLEKLICVKKMKGNMDLKRYNERRIDL